MAKEVNHLENIVRRKMIRAPTLRPKTKLGQRTLGKDPMTNVQYQQLKQEYYHSASIPMDEKNEKREEFNSFLSYLRNRIVMNDQLVNAPDGIYTWIMKRGDIYATPLMTNQEIGSLPANINTLTLHSTNLGALNRVTLKNTRNTSAKPMAAGELLITRSSPDGSVRIYFNIQSGTFSESLLKCRVSSLAQQRGINKKTLKNVAPQLRSECRDEMVEQILQTLSTVTKLPSDHIQFLGCEEKIQQELEAIPFLHQGKYDFGPCRDENDYFESLAGRNLIRRFTMYTSANNIGRFNRFFNKLVTPSSVLGRRSAPNKVNNNHLDNQSSKKQKTRKNHKNKNNTNHK